MWTLILTMAAWSSQGGNAIHSLPGFSSKESCMIAAQSWVDQIQPLTRVSGDYARALCVKM